MYLEKTWRWFGLKDNIKLSDLKQMGIEGVVTALHHIPNGEVWPLDEILKLKHEIESHGMRWAVVESLPVSEGIKTQSGDWKRLINNYQQSLQNLGKCGIKTVCYNFMPVLDWVRTNLSFKLPSGAKVMYFDFPVFVAFDAYILKRLGAENDYPAEIVAEAKKVFQEISAKDAEELAYNIIVLTQGFINGSVDTTALNYKEIFLEYIRKYNNVDKEQLRRHLSYFLNSVVPVAEEYGVNLCIHPDDPPFPVLGLPRIVSTFDDLKWICEQHNSLNNGITFCTGSLSVNPSNKIEAMVEEFGPRIHFAHLRNNKFKSSGSFYESGHIEGEVNMYKIVKLLISEQKRRVIEGRVDARIPFRPDHGIRLLDDFLKEANPGYPLIGRLIGLSELSGIQYSINQELT